MPISLRFMLLFAFWAYFIPGLSQEMRKTWESGPLSWDDFRGIGLKGSELDSELKYQITYSSGKITRNDTLIIAFQTHAYMLRQTSWVTPEGKTNTLLRYNQAIFDLVEIHRRKLQGTLHRIDQLFAAQYALEYHHDLCEQELQRFQQEAAYGTNTDALSEWETWIQYQLRDYPLEAVPIITDKPFGYGINLGVGPGRFTSSLAEHFKPTFNVVFGFDVAVKNTTLYLNASLTGSRVARAFSESAVLWPEGFKTSIAVIDLSLGQTLLNTNKHKLAPFVGIGLLEISARDTAQVFDNHYLLHTGFIYGLNYEYKLIKAFRITPGPFGKYRERAEHNVRVRLYATSASFEQLAGTSVNLGIGYALFGRFIRID